MNATVAKISALFAELQFFERVFVKKKMQFPKLHHDLHSIFALKYFQFSD